VVLAFGLLGASANAKGPIALFVAALIWLPFLWLTRGRTGISGRHLSLGLVLFLAIGAPWYMALGARDPDILSEWIQVQLLARLTGSQADLGHSHGPFYLLGSWPLALLPWTPLVGLALWRLRPSKGWRRADPLDLYLLLWATVPVLIFSIPRTKIATYLLPALPGAALAISRALETGRLADRTARRALVATVALASGLALVFAVAALWPAWIRSNRFEPTLVVAGPAFSGALAAVALLTPLALARLSRGPGASARAIRGTALATGMIFVLGYNVVAPGFASWREEGLLARSVPGARLLAFGVDRVSALFYFGDVDRYLFAHGRTEEQRQGQPDDDAPGASPEEGLGMLRGEQPVFCLAKEKYAAGLMEASGAVILRRRLSTVLLANPAAQRALAAQGEGRSR
jgi:4-amino-4-deoxy-L-arabinose transferase-like glycosyltransferase